VCPKIRSERERFLARPTPEKKDRFLLRTHWRRQAPIAAAILTVLSLGLSGTPASAQDPSSVRINEVESSDGSPGDWVELVNDGMASADLSGWVVKDNDNSHSYKISSGTSLAPGAFLAVDVEPAYGLGSADSARLFRADGSTLVDSYTWSDHASTTYGRCPDGTGAFIARGDEVTASRIARPRWA
jgi:hypothetical protein